MATATEQKVWTAEEIRDKLQHNQAWLERGIVTIYRYQTAEEQVVHETVEDNGVGFNGPDANYLSYLARWIMDGKHLSGDHLAKGRKKMLKYAGQLARIANAGQ